MGNLHDIYEHIESNQERHLGKVREYLRQPSISATGEGVRQCANMLAAYYQKLGCQEIELIETPKHPGVWAYYDAGAPLTFAVYGMYDVQPVEAQDWHYDPFGAELASQGPFPKVVIARGAFNSKGPYRLFLNALESIIAVCGTLPVNLMFLSEGEEEIGSTHYKDIVNRYGERVKKANALLDIEANQNKEGKIVVKLGNKGIVYLELIASGKNWGRGPQSQPIHSSRKAVVNNPAWRLLLALNTLATPDEKTILIEGIYDEVIPPSPTDLKLIDALGEDFDDAVYANEWDISRWIDDVKGSEWITQLLFSPSFNVDGYISGHTGEGTLTIIPHKARAKIDIRLVPNMQPRRVIELLRKHLDRHGFSDIEIKEEIAYGWNKTAPDEPAVQTMLKVYEKHGIPYEVWPFSPGSEPLYLFTQPPYHLPMLRFGVGHGSRNHASDEYLVIEGNGKVAGLVESEKAYVDLLFALAQNGHSNDHSQQAPRNNMQVRAL